MELGTIEREIHIEASPEVVFDVVSSPEHLRGWWPDEAEFPAVPGGAGRIGFGDVSQDGTWEQFTVVDAVPSRLFSFRWTHAEGEVAGPGNSFLVVFELEPAGTGTLLRMTESGFRERGWDEAKVVAEYSAHVTGWDFYLPRLPTYAAKVGAGA
ncbi:MULTISPECIES: SRPBCC domain-containing protein [unclassified Plantactinospora]|uniref:SRPBCC domain-containing protein n=1 Tax=unclassified Plantactinospora TaxID=2631981 RepID=UPI000D158AA2|nr:MULTISPECIES: SRPBCC domain-containing protein [unclassified Plantactinospora]AVT29343.1 polyketide cyclase [Plantactinospora sp. BC1]AVT35760.1 polyketide cyclase [Plantactinospora sp. BB1]